MYWQNKTHGKRNRCLLGENSICFETETKQVDANDRKLDFVYNTVRLNQAFDSERSILYVTLYYNNTECFLATLHQTDLFKIGFKYFESCIRYN